MFVMICFKTYNKMLLVLFINVYFYFFHQPKEKNINSEFMKWKVKKMF